MNQIPHDLPPLEAYEESVPSSVPSSAAKRTATHSQKPSPQPEVREQSQQSNSDSNFADRLKMRVFSTKHALSITNSTTRGGWETVMIESAPKLSEESKQYNWSEKTSIQVTKQELPYFIMVMLGLTKDCKFDSHGAANDKGFQIERQDRGVFFKTFAKSKLHPVQVPYEDAVMIGHLALSQYVKNFNGTITADVAMNSFRVLAQQKQRLGTK